nr:hypothetical protein [Bacteroidota bacterium]
LNETKTKIEKLPQSIDEPWVVELRSLSLGDFRKPERQAADIKHLFEKAFLFAKAYPEKSILAYSITKLEKVTFHPDNWELVENLLLQCILVEPRTVSFVLPVLTTANEEGHSISYQNIREVMNKLISYHAQLGHGDEVTWGLWGLIEFKQKVVAENAKILSETVDPLVALLALDANERGLIPDKLNTSFWLTSLDLNDLYGKSWLLAYEGTGKAWISFPDVVEKLNDDPNWGLLRRNMCSFYDSTAKTEWLIHEPYI